MPSFSATIAPIRASGRPAILSVIPMDGTILRIVIIGVILLLIIWEGGVILILEHGQMKKRVFLSLECFPLLEQCCLLYNNFKVFMMHMYRILVIVQFMIIPLESQQQSKFFVVQSMNIKVLPR